VRDAILDTTVALVQEQGVLSVTMSQIAEQAGIGRATLYKYFPDVEAILQAWHEREIARHLDQLSAIRDRPGRAATRLAEMLNAFGEIAMASHGHADTELAFLLHRGHERIKPEHHLLEMLKAVLEEAADEGDIRADVPAHELASYCLHALAAARTLKSKTAVRRLVEVTLAGLRS
jgi:AcrR family transcriptional regulator